MVIMAAVVTATRGTAVGGDRTAAGAVYIQHGGGSCCQWVFIVSSVCCLGGSNMCDAITAYRISRHRRFWMRRDSTTIIFTQPIWVGQTVRTSGIQFDGFTDTCAYMRRMGVGGVHTYTQVAGGWVVASTTELPIGRQLFSHRSYVSCSRRFALQNGVGVDELSSPQTLVSLFGTTYVVLSQPELLLVIHIAGNHTSLLNLRIIFVNFTS